MAKECYECGNTNEKEIEYKTVTTDEGDGFNEKKIKLWSCKDNDACMVRAASRWR